MSCIYAELNISFGTTEERTGNQNSKLEYVSPFLTKKKKKAIIGILKQGNTRTTRRRVSSRPEKKKKKGGGRKAAAFSFALFMIHAVDRLPALIGSVQ